MLKKMINEVLEEDLRIDKHPKADIIKKALDDGNHLITFSDINKVGINPKTAFNTPAGIYGWHFAINIVRGAKKNQIFASERKFGHLLRIKNPDKVLWLGTDKTGTSAKSPAAAMELFAKAYPILNEPTIQFDPGGDIDPRWQGTDDGSKKISAAEWLRDSVTVRQYAHTSDREVGGSSKSEKLYDLVMATSAVLELDQVSGKKKTVTANALLRSLGIEAVVDVECGGIIHHAETCQGFFTSTAGLEHVATIENRMYSDNKLAVTRILQSPNAPEEKLWDAIRALTRDFAYDIGKEDKVTGLDIDQYDVMDILYNAIDGIENEDTGNQNLTSEMLAHIFKFASKRMENNSLIASKVLEAILAHPNAPVELLSSHIETAIKTGGSTTLAAIASNPGISSEDLGRIGAAGSAVDERVESALGRNINTPPEVLDKLAEMFLNAGSDAGSIAALKNPNTPPETVKKWAGLLKRAIGNGATGSLLNRILAALSNPSLDDEVLADLIFDENVVVKDDFSTLRYIVGLENIPPEFMDEIVAFLAKGDYAQSGPTATYNYATLGSLWANPSLSDKNLRILFDAMPELIEENYYDEIVAGLVWRGIHNRNASKETLTHMGKVWKKNLNDLIMSGNVTTEKAGAIAVAFSKKDVWIDMPSFGQQKESIQNTLRKMIKEELLTEGRWEAEVTEMTRDAMPTIVKYAKEGLDGADSDEDIVFVDDPEVVDYQAEKGNWNWHLMPDGILDHVASVRFTFEKIEGAASGRNFSIAGGYQAYKEFEDDDKSKAITWNGSMVFIASSFTPDFNEQDLNDYLANLKASLIHELEHSTQPEDMLTASDPPEVDGERQSDHDFSQLTGLAGYFLSQSELEAFAKGMYKEAKFKKAPYSVMARELADRYNDLFLSKLNKAPEDSKPSYSAEELSSFFDEFHSRLVDIGKVKYPSILGQQKENIQNTLRNLIKEEIGYKIVAHENGEFFSLQNPDLKYNIKMGSEESPTNGMYLGTTEEFVTDYYAEMTDKQDALLTYEYDPADITLGNADEEGEVKVTKATLVSSTILGQQKENIQNILRRMIREEITPDAERKETEIHLAENGDCGVFAIALLRELLDAGVDDAELMIIGDPSTYNGEGDSPTFEDFYNIDIFHIAVFYNGKYYDVNGRTTPETMLGDFVPYGGEGITPDDYSPAFGRDFLSESFVVGSREYLDNTLEGFVEATTNVQTSVENYSERAKQVAEEITGQQKESLQNTLRQMIKEELLSEMFVKGHDDGDNIIAYKENIWKLRMDIDDDDPVRQELAQALGIEGEYDDIWELKELIEDANRTDILVGEFDLRRDQLSLQRSGSFHLDPKSSVLVKKVVKALGARSVVYAPNGEGEEYVGRSSIKGKVADIMYHGTTSNYLPGLLRLGLVPGKKETNYEGISHPSAVFFTSRFDEAQHHAAHTAKKVGGDPVIVELKVPDPALLIPDYDVDMGAGDTGCYDYICQTLRDKQSSQSDVDADSFSLSREVGVYGYKGRVPAAAISGYYILMNAQDELGDAMFYADREQYTEATPEEAAIYVQTKEDFGYGSLEEPEHEEGEDDWGTNESILSSLRSLIKEERQSLQEGRYEAATTELTRMVMPTIKYIIQKLLPHTTEPDKYSANGIHTLETKMYVSGKTLPKELDDKMYKAEFRFFADPKLFEETGDKFQVGGSFMSDPYDRKGSFFQISSYFDPSMTLQDINAYLATLKGITIHEIQHGAQEEDVFATGDARHSNPLGDGRHNHNTIDGIRAYYASAAEVDSYTKELYKKAKYHKKPFPEVMDARLQQFFDMFRRRRNNMNAEDERETPGEFRVKYSEEELNDFFFKELRDILITAAKKKYPEAQGI